MIVHYKKDGVWYYVKAYKKDGEYYDLQTKEKISKAFIYWVE